MDPKFLEFWGNYLLAVSRGQQQMEDLNRWTQQGFSGVQQLNDMFKTVYGLPANVTQSAGHDDTWQKAVASFNASYKEYFEQFGWVPRQEVEALTEENAALTKKIAALEDTVQRLRSLLDDENPVHAKTVGALQELVEKQSEEFNTLMQSLSEAVDQAVSKDPSKKK